jgi:tRNA pseudouridine38-40 synthase
MDKTNVKLTISYDGTGYCGFQTQGKETTIEDRIKLALKNILGEETVINCAGRTDAGVHAEGQVINFFSPKSNMSETNWFRAMNSLLPPDIRVMKCEFTSEDFHARRSAIYREYWYRMINSQTISALDKRYAAHFYRFHIDTGLMNSYGSILLGENDFTSFCSSNDTNRTKTRYMYSIGVVRDNDLVTIKIIANAFLHNMVRVIVGTMLFLHKSDSLPERMKEILESRNRNLAGPTAIPKGLIFKRVYYDETVLKKEWFIQKSVD